MGRSLNLRQALTQLQISQRLQAQVGDRHCVGERRADGDQRGGYLCAHRQVSDIHCAGRLAAVIGRVIFVGGTHLHTIGQHKTIARRGHDHRHGDRLTGSKRCAGQGCALRNSGGRCQLATQPRGGHTADNAIVRGQRIDYL